MSCCSSTSLLHVRRHMVLILLFAWAVFSKIAYISLLCTMFLISYKCEGNSLLPNSQFESMLHFARVLADFIILACKKMKGGLNNYFLSLVLFICFSIIRFLILDYLLLWIFS